MKEDASKRGVPAHRYRDVGPQLQESDLQPDPMWKEWDSAWAIRKLWQAIKNDWGVDPELMQQMPKILSDVVLHSSNQRAVMAASKCIAALDRINVERARLILDTEKLKYAQLSGTPLDGGTKTINVHITNVKTRLAQLMQPSLGRPLVPGLEDFSIKDAETEPEEA